MSLVKGIQLAGGVVVSDDPVLEAEVEEKKETVMGLELASDNLHRGTNKSGRTWKTVRKEKASMVIYKTMKKTLGSTFEQRQAEKLRLQEARELQEEMLTKKRARIEVEQKKKAEKAKRKAENELKSSKIQVMSRPDKIKKMSKKQLRSVYKTRMGEDGVVRLVGAYE